MDAAVAALLGAAIGAVGTLGNAWLQQRHQSKREALKAAVELGQRDFDHSLWLAQRSGKGGEIPPLSLFVAYHADVLKALAAGGFGPEEIRRIDKAQREALLAVKNRG